MKWKSLISHMAGMSERAWIVWKTGMQLALLLLCGGVLLALSPADHASGLARACYESSQGCFLIGNLFAVIFEDQQSRR